MKYLVTAGALMVCIALIVRTSMTFENANAYGSGAPAGYTGSPGDGLDCSQCHAGNGSSQPLSGTLTSNIPVSGYVGGNTYSFTATFNAPGITKFGFEAAVQDNNGNAIGLLVNTSNETQMVAGNTYVTHTSAGTSGSSPKSWTFDWTAPLGSDSATVYVAYNAANGNFLPTGDSIYTDHKTYYVDPTGVDEVSAVHGMHVSPNPASEWVSIQSPGGWDPDNMRLLTLSGTEINLHDLTIISGSGYFRMDVRNLPAGVYLLYKSDAQHDISRICITH